MPRILVVDDDLNLRRILCFFLKEAGHDTVEARSADEAFRFLETQRPDAILLDVMMPGKNGLETCKELKGKPSLATIPVILCTARGRKEDVLLAIKSGADDYVLKPFTRDTVLQKLERVLVGGARAPAGAPALAAERRRTTRAAVEWVVSWGASKSLGLTGLFKNRVLNISLWGFAFEFNRCTTCTGYEQGTTHPLCLLARHARRFPDSEVLEFVLSISREVVLEVRGRIAHIYQPPDWPHAEIVGVAFQELSSRAEQLLRKHIA